MCSRFVWGVIFIAKRFYNLKFLYIEVPIFLQLPSSVNYSPPKEVGASQLLLKKFDSYDILILAGVSTSP